VPGKVKDSREVTPSGRVRTITFVGANGEEDGAGSTIRASTRPALLDLVRSLLSLSPAGPETTGSPSTSWARPEASATGFYLRPEPPGGLEALGGC